MRKSFALKIKYAVLGIVAVLAMSVSTLACPPQAGVVGDPGPAVCNCANPVGQPQVVGANYGQVGAGVNYNQSVVGSPFVVGANFAASPVVVASPDRKSVV